MCQRVGGGGGGGGLDGQTPRLATTIKTGMAAEPRVEAGNEEIKFPVHLHVSFLIVNKSPKKNTRTNDVHTF